MNKNTISLIEEIFSRYPELKGSPVPFYEIDDAEKSLASKFPDDYRKFLNKYGSGIVGAYPVYGLRPAVAMGNEWSIIDVTRRFRQDGWPGTEDWLIISTDHSGNPVGIDDNGQIWISDHDFGDISLVANDFEEFIVKFCLQK